MRSHLVDVNSVDPHRSAGMQFLGGDADLGAEAGYRRRWSLMRSPSPHGVYSGKRWGASDW